VRGVVFLGERKVELRSFPDPTPGPGEVVLEMKASGMCGSDLKFYRSAPGEAQKALGLGDRAEPFIGGHEPCGVVVARGPGVSEKEAPTGQRVMDHHYAGCGVCSHCRVGWSQLCRAGITVYGVTAHGGHADYLKVPVRTIVEMPEELSFAEGAAVACGTGTAFGALKRMNMNGGDTLAVFGQGPVGLSATVIGVAMGARVIAVETSPERMKLAEAFGADAVINASQEDPVAALNDLTSGKGVDLALECSGAAAAHRGARCAPGARRATSAKAATSRST
jgi:D-arabinose 1-dehydrogenase-like Zn-dependent alcohol dehydrogenase